MAKESLAETPRVNENRWVILGIKLRKRHQTNMSGEATYITSEQTSETE